MSPTEGKCAACSMPVLLAHVAAKPPSDRRSPFLKLTPRAIEPAALGGLAVRTGDLVNGREAFEHEGSVYLEHVCRRARPPAPRDLEGRPLAPVACRACGARVLWITTPAGKRSPCDYPGVEGTLTDSKPKPPERVRGFTAAGESVVVSTVPTLLPGEPATVYVSHFATCPEADRFRRKGTRR